MNVIRMSGTLTSFLTKSNNNRANRDRKEMPAENHPIKVAQWVCVQVYPTVYRVKRRGWLWYSRWATIRLATNRLKKDKVTRY